MKQRLSRRTFLASTAATAASLTLLAACGEDEPAAPAAGQAVTGQQPDPTPTEEVEKETPTAPAVVSGERLTIAYWGSFSGRNGEAEQEVVNRFNASQDEIVVEYQYQGTYEETAQALTRALTAGQAPAVSLLSDVWWFRFYLNEMLAPLNDFIDAHGLDTDDYVDSLFNEGVRQDTVYWIPFARSTPLFYYNKEIWEEAGLPDRGPETWDEFEEWTEALVRRDGNTLTRAAFAHPGAASYIAWLFQCVIWQFNGRYSDPDFTIRINEPEGVEAGEFYRQSVQQGWATTPQDLNLEFTNRLTAAMMASTAGLGAITAAADFEVGTAFLPEKYQFGCCTGGAGLAIVATAPPEQQAAGFEFIKFATSPEITTYWSQTTGYMPVRKSAAADMEDFYAENPNFRTAVEQLELTQPQDAARVFIPGGDQIIGRGLERITIAGEEPRPVFDDVARTLETEAQPVIEQVERIEG